MSAPFDPGRAAIAAVLPLAPAPEPARRWWSSVGIWPWCAVGMLLALEAVWLAISPIGMSADTPGDAGLLCSSVALCLLVGWRFREHERFRTLFLGGAFLLLAWPALRLLNHLTMSIPLPLADARLAGWDAAIGFDWFSYVDWADSNHVFLELVEICYGSLTVYSCYLFAVLALLGRNPAQRCAELVSLFIITALVCTLVGALFPAHAAMAYYAPSPELFAHIGPKTGVYHLQDLLALRGDPDHRLDLSDMPGLVTFPSFHTAMGIVAIYCARGSWWLLAPMLVINLAMIAATPVFGSHYGIDVIAGASVALAAILAYRRWLAEPEETPKKMGPPGQGAPSDPESGALCGSE